MFQESNNSIIKSVESDVQNPIRMNYGEKSVKLSKKNSFLFKILSEWTMGQI